MREPSEYVYRMVQIPPNIQVQASAERGTEAAEYLNELVAKMAHQGWEFYRIDTIGVIRQFGCLTALFGILGTRTEHYVVSFRMLRSKCTQDARRVSDKVQEGRP